MRNLLIPVLCGWVLVACTPTPSAHTELPTAYVRLAATISAAPVSYSLAATPLPSPTSPAPSATQIATTPASPLEQYRAWMQEARTLYPYSEALDQMWAVMLCESSGRANAVAGEYYGLFQYSPATWAGDWNPYRDQSILDARAQIFATAKAWYEGNQGWWGCYR